MKDNAWFVGFAPRSAPEIVVVALFEHGEHGSSRRPIVRDVIKAYFDKKARLANGRSQSREATPPAPAARRPEESGGPPSRRRPDNPSHEHDRTIVPSAISTGRC